MCLIAHLLVGIGSEVATLNTLIVFIDSPWLAAYNQISGGAVGKCATNGERPVRLAPRDG